jgi:predicted XRE-type DNA-binding protein
MRFPSAWHLRILRQKFSEVSARTFAAVCAALHHSTLFLQKTIHAQPRLLSEFHLGTPLTSHIKYDILCAVNTKEEIETSPDTGTNALHRAMMEAKERSGLSQKEIAARSGMAQPNISRIERGGAVSFNAFSEYISACGFDFTVNLRPVGNDTQRKGF